VVGRSGREQELAVGGRADLRGALGVGGQRAAGKILSGGQQGQRNQGEQHLFL
jgi:hypothetical protein